MPDTYVVSRIKGDAEGKFDSSFKEVTYYYTDYTPKSIRNADFNGDGKVNVKDLALLQKYIVKLKTPTVDEKALDLNYDYKFDIKDTLMLAKAIVKKPVSSGKVTVNHYYTDGNGVQKKLTDSVVYTGRAGSTYDSKSLKIVGYKVDTSRMPRVSGYIPFGKARSMAG